MTEQQAIDRARIAQFSIPFNTIDNEPDLARAILKDVIVLHAEAKYESRAVHYVGIHPSFPIRARHSYANDASPMIAEEILESGAKKYTVTWKE